VFVFVAVITVFKTPPFVAVFPFAARMTLVTFDQYVQPGEFKACLSVECYFANFNKGDPDAHGIPLLLFGHWVPTLPLFCRVPADRAMATGAFFAETIFVNILMTAVASGRQHLAICFGPMATDTFDPSMMTD
jgi:hypothetical protein